MRIVDRKTFFEGYRRKFGRIKQAQVNALEAILRFLEADDKIMDIRWAAYMFATFKWETGDTFRPIREYGTREYFIKRYGSQTKVGKVLGNDTPEEGADYPGRGLSQNTGKNNYEMLERELPKAYPEVIARWEAKHGRKFDLTVGDQPNDSGDPDALLDPEISYIAASHAMRHGLYTGKRLSYYINDATCNYLLARKIINGQDQAKRIADYAETFEWILRRAA